MIILNPIHNFFHPLSKEHPYVMTFLSIVSIIAVSILTKELFKLAFVSVNLSERRINKNIKAKNVEAEVIKVDKTKDIIHPQDVNLLINKDMGHFEFELFIAPTAQIKDKVDGKSVEVIRDIENAHLKTTANVKTNNTELLDLKTKGVNATNPPVELRKDESLQVQSAVPVPPILKLAENQEIKAEVMERKNIDMIKEFQLAHLNKFKALAEANQWGNIHGDHFDWWMFPVKRASSAWKTQFTVNDEEVEALKADPEFMKNYKEGVILAVKGWGWDLEKECEFNPPLSWTGYNVRLAKMSDSLKIFGETELHKKLVIFFKKHCEPKLHQFSTFDLDWVKKSLGVDA